MIKNLFVYFFFFFFNDTATTEIYTLSLHDALPISRLPLRDRESARAGRPGGGRGADARGGGAQRACATGRPPRPPRRHPVGICLRLPADGLAPGAPAPPCEPRPPRCQGGQRAPRPRP